MTHWLEVRRHATLFSARATPTGDNRVALVCKVLSPSLRHVPFVQIRADINPLDQYHGYDFIVPFIQPSFALLDVEEADIRYILHFVVSCVGLTGKDHEFTLRRDAAQGCEAAGDRLRAVNAPDPASALHFAVSALRKELPEVIYGR